ncbi:hypothetical protein B9Z55_007748 [Caenorhabditis nigoni]|uniref:BTB domain-containing protein n=1 Tax=Caenorhabditis nigoni TaxID=1611254 RepID=A0A2G5VB37_9PELO|nr:hypothetical protein B9Z55_007748 [Caenorhabditis nigoni]
MTTLPNQFPDETVEGILAIADFVDAKTAFRRCEDFLMTSSKNPLRNKFGLAIKYKMDNLKNKCLSEMKNSDDVRWILPEISDYIEHPRNCSRKCCLLSEFLLSNLLKTLFF